MHFSIVGRIGNVKVIARGKSVRTRHHLNQKFGAGQWRKMKGEAMIRLYALHHVELHWYEAHGIGRVYFKRKRILD